jgi:hypothetical protein
MRLSSARELKQELADALRNATPGFSAGDLLPKTLRTRGSTRRQVLSSVASCVGARGVRRCLRAEVPLVALGVTPSRKNAGYKLAIRLQEDSTEALQYAAYVAGRACDEVDIQYVGAITVGTSRTHRRRVRPLAPGVSVGHFSTTAGTLGGFVRDVKGRLGMLSNSHVLGAINAVKKGDANLQPGPFDGGVNPKDRVGGLVPTEELTTDLKVWKIGRTTRTTHGVITAIEVDGLQVGYDTAVYSFDAQIEIVGARGSFSRGGDSGSFILDRSNRGVGLLFAGSETGGPNGSGRTYANSLETAMSLLGLDVACDS